MDSPRAFKLTWLATDVAARFSTRLAGFFAARLWFTPWAVDNGERSRRRHARWLEGAERVVFTVNGRTLAGFIAGDGPTVLLVHGWGERAATLGALVRPLTDRGFRVVGVDLPAHGDSPGRRTDIPEEAEIVRALIDQLDGVYAVIAHSMGGAVTTVALARGADAERVVLVAPAVRLEHAMDVFVRALRIRPRAEQGLRRYIDRRYGPSVWNDFAADVLAPSLRQPALIVHDVDDDQVAVRDGRKLAAVWPGAHFVETEGLGHIKVLGHPHVLDEIGRWLEPAKERAAV